MRSLPVSLLLIFAAALCSGAPLETSQLTVKANPCPSGWYHATTVDQCYLIPNIFLPFEDAKNYCTNVTGGELVSVYSAAEDAAITTYIKAQSFVHLYPLWIGLQTYAYYPYFQWQDRKSANYTHFVNGTKPSSLNANSCFVWESTVGNTGWTTLNCKYQQPFICKQHAANCATVNVNGTNGTLTSPNYPGIYNLGDTCFYHITVPAGNVVHLDFTVVDIDYYSDVYVYDGLTNSAALLGYAAQSYWDYYGDDEFDSTGTSMTLRFVTSTFSYPYYNGWSAKFTAIPAPVPVQLNGTSGGLTSPNYPENYTNGVELFYQINAPSNYVLHFSIWDFITESGYDWLLITDSSDNSRLLNWSGNHTTDVPKSIVSKGNTVKVTWHTDLSVSRTGFNMTWVALPAWG